MKRRQHDLPRASVTSIEKSPSQVVVQNLDMALESCFSPAPYAVKFSKSRPSGVLVNNIETKEKYLNSLDASTQNVSMNKLSSKSVVIKDGHPDSSKVLNRGSSKGPRIHHDTNNASDTTSTTVNCKEPSKKDKECSKLVQKIVENQTKEKVDLRGRFFDINQLRNVFEALVSNQSCTSLDLRCCMIRNTGCKELCRRLLQHGCNLRWIDLAENDLTEVCIPDLLESLRNSPLIWYIDLRSNAISHNALKDIERFLTAFPRNLEGKRRKIELDAIVLEGGQAEDLSMDDESHDSHYSVDMEARSSFADEFDEEFHENDLEEGCHDMCHSGMVGDGRADDETEPEIPAFFQPRNSLKQNSNVVDKVHRQKNYLQPPQFKKSSLSIGKNRRNLKLKKKFLPNQSQKALKDTTKNSSESNETDAWLSLWDKKCAKMAKKSKKRISTSSRSTGSSNSFPAAYGVGSLIPTSKIRQPTARGQPLHNDQSQMSMNDDLYQPSTTDDCQEFHVQIQESSNSRRSQRLDLCGIVLLAPL